MSVMSDTVKLSSARKGDRGVIVRVGDHAAADEHALELERRLLELGFVEGAGIEVLHEGLFGRDPIAMKVDDMRVALRRHEAASLIVRFQPAHVAYTGTPPQEVPA
jgi:ferrous iron transport protein A